MLIYIHIVYKKGGSIMEKAYNLNEVAILLGIKVRTVRSWISEGKIKGQKLKGTNRWFVMESEIRRVRGEEEANEN